MSLVALLLNFDHLKMQKCSQKRRLTQLLRNAEKTVGKWPTQPKEAALCVHKAAQESAILLDY
jgi:hypothetical protein